MRWDPQRYSQTEQLRLSTFTSFLNWADLKNLAHKSILDIGCGQGFIDYFLATTYPTSKILAIDNDPHMITYAEEHFSQHNLLFQLAAAEESGISTQFDIILSIACLHWVQDQEKALKNIHNLLKPNGYALLLIYPEQPYLWRSLLKTTSLEHWKVFFINFDPKYYFYNEEIYQKLAPTLGLMIEKIELLEECIHIQNQTHFEQLISSWLPHLNVIPPRLHSQFLREVCDDVFKNMQRDNKNHFSEYTGISLKILLKKYSSENGCL